MAIRINLRPAEVTMYTCKDIHAGYGLPFSCANDKLAIQAFKLYCMTDPEGIANCNNIELYKCGKFNRDTGEYRNTKMTLLERGKKYGIQNRVQRESKNSSASRQ